MTPYKDMYSVWNSVLPWVLLCCSLVSTTDTSFKIILHEQNATKCEGSCVTINCTYMPEDDMQLLWFKDPEWDDKENRFKGIIVYSNTKDRPQVPEYSDRVEFFNERILEKKKKACTLKINGLKKNDSGKYAFRFIRNNDKYIGRKFELTVIDNPCEVHIRTTILKPLREGDTLHLSCTTSAACGTYPKWQWSDSNEDLSIENREKEVEKRSELKYNVSWKDDGRTLTCHPPESYCEDRSFTLRVEYAPKETKVIGGSHLKDVKEGQKVNISCSSKAQPKATFTWFKQNSSFSQPGENLTLPNVIPDKGGIFYCQAKNQYGTDDSLGININIIYAPKGVSISPTYNDLVKGDHLTLKCTVQNSNPEVEKQSYRWYKDDQEINQQTGNIFTLPSLTELDKGSYKCQAKNSVGETMSAYATQVHVKYVPQNTYIQGTSDIKLNLELNLKCVTEADPLPNKYYWYFKPKHEQQFVTFSHTNQVYLVENVAVSNAGSYKCSAQNAIGSGANSTELNVLVLYPPKQPNLTMKHVAKENEDYSITCTVESFPESELTLTRSSLTNPQKNEPLMKVQSNFLRFSAKVSPADAGVYICVAKNTEGENSSKNQLKVLYAPRNVIASANPSEEPKEGSDLTLTCKANSVPQVSGYTWMKSGTHPEPVGHGQKITLRSLKSSDSGNYNCISTNEIGNASSSQLFIRVKYRPRITIIHNMTSLGLWKKMVPIHLTCSVQCYPQATFIEWYKLEENTTVLSEHQNYTVQPENPGTYYCLAGNDAGKSRSEPLPIYLNHILIKRLVQVIISLLVILSLIGVIFLLHRIFLSKKSSGNNDGAQRSFFFSAAPLWSLSTLRSTGVHTNLRENMVVERSSAVSGIRDNHPTTAVQSNPAANRQAGRPNYNIHTMYDAVKLPSSKPKQQNYTEDDLYMTTVNYDIPQFMDGNNQNKSVPSHDGCNPDYAKVLKNKQIAQERQSGREDYENVPAAGTLKQSFPNIDWDSDSSESEEEVNYAKVAFTAISHCNPQKDSSSSDEEEKIEYSEVKM